MVLDLWSRRVIGWAASASLETSAVVRALRMALRHRQPPRGLVHHSDRGVQYASREYQLSLGVAGILPSMSRPGNPYDNAGMETFMATYNRECVGLADGSGGYATRADALANFLADFIDYAERYYNRVRRHSALGYQSPVAIESILN